MEKSKQLIFVIDDQRPARMVLAEIIRSIDPDRIDVIEFSDAPAALAAARLQMPNLVLADYSMPGMNGLEFLADFRKEKGTHEVPVIIVTSHDEYNIRISALRSGATDFLGKPVDPVECQARCINLLNQNEQALIIQDRAKWLERQVIEAVKEVGMREKETLLRLAKCGEFRDEETGDHVLRMSKYSRLIAEAVGMHTDRCDSIERAAPLHDIGKIGVPDHILLKPGKHTESEQKIMREHTVIGFEILRDSPSKYLQMGSIISHSHHERFDGSGYPQGLIGEEIPLPARIVAVADVFDALTSVRPYKPAWSINNAFDYLNEQRGNHFDPELVTAFISKKSDITKIYTTLDKSDLQEQAS